VKVLHVIPFVASRYGGPSQAVFHMCRGLRDAGVDASVLTTDADGPGRLPVKLGDEIDYRGVPTRFFPRQWSEAFKYSRPLSRWLDRHVAEFDVLHLHSVYSHSSLAAGRAARREGIPYLVRPYGTLSSWALKFKPVRKRVFWYLGVKRLLAGAAAIHYTSQAERRDAESGLAITRGVVLPLGVDSTLIDVQTAEDAPRRSTSAADAPYVLMLGRLHVKKGLDLFLPAFCRVTGQPPFDRWKLLLVGDGDAAYVERLKAMVREAGAEERVTFAGWLDGSAKSDALRGAALLAMPSHQENFGLSAFEAMACGVAVLVSDQIDTADEIAQAGAGWISPLTEADLERTLGLAMEDDAGRVTRGEAGRDLVWRRFTWSAATEPLVAFYEQLLAERRRTAEGVAAEGVRVG